MRFIASLVASGNGYRPSAKQPAAPKVRPGFSSALEEVFGL